MNLTLKQPENIILKPVIVVFGVGGAGGNAVNNMIASNLQGATFVVANTDAQALEHSKADNKIQLGVHTTRGLGAGASPEVGMAAAEESEDEIRSYLENCNMVFITAGMGGGTGTGAAPVIAKISQELGILTVGVVTKPFHFEGAHRMKTADSGLEELQKYVDTLIVIPNQNLFRIANESTTFADAFKMADDVLHNGVRSVTDLMIMPGLINLDYADIKAVMSEMGKAMMGTGESSGENRAVEAAERAIANPLLEHHSMQGAKGVLINITGGPDMKLFEVDAAANRIREEVGDIDANIIFGSTFGQESEGTIRVSVVATGIDAEEVMSIRSSVEDTTSYTSQMAEEEVSSESTNFEEENQMEHSDSVAPSQADQVEERAYDPSLQHSGHEGQANTMPEASEAQDSGPLALLRRMWGMGSVAPKERPTPPHVKLNQNREGQTVRVEAQSHSPEKEPEMAGSGDIYEVPAFLRRK
jgi:cell division protein FtsZ